MKAHPEGYLVKLVRDRVRQALGGDGTVTYRPMPRDEHVKQLRRKLVEEAAEYALDPSIEELAQVLEVIDALRVVDLGVNPTELHRAQRRQREERGGLREGIGMYVHHPMDTA